MVANKDLLKQYLKFSENIKRLRKERNLTQEDLAELADLSISYIKQIESCKDFKNISLTTMLKLSKALDTSISSLFKNWGACFIYEVI